MLLQDRGFETTRTILFDGEAALRSQKAKDEIYNTLGILVRADVFFKRSMAERLVREIKLRMSIHLDFEGSTVIMMVNIIIICIMCMFRTTPFKMEILSTLCY